MTRLRGALLTVGAIVGSLCLLVALAGVLFGVKPLVFKSGSMSPTIPAGALALSRPVDAPDIRAGDVVSTFTSDHVRVTHRVVKVVGNGDSRSLTLKGDANPTPDQEVYTVTGADRVFWSVPWVGRIIVFFGTPIGLMLLGALAVVVLYAGFRRPRDGGGSHSAPRATEAPGGTRHVVAGVAPMVALVMAATGVTTTWAAFSDSAAATGGAVSAYTLPNAVALPNSSNCSASNGLLGSSITFHWTGVVPAAAPRPQLADLEYQLTFINRDNGSTLNTATVAHTGAAGSQQTYTSSASTLAGLLGLNLASKNNVTLQITAHLKNTSWHSLTPVGINWTVTTLLGIATFTCNA